MLIPAKALLKSSCWQFGALVGKISPIVLYFREKFSAVFYLSSINSFHSRHFDLLKKTKHMCKQHLLPQSCQWVSMHKNEVQEHFHLKRTLELLSPDYTTLLHNISSKMIFFCSFFISTRFNQKSCPIALTKLLLCQPWQLLTNLKEVKTIIQT